MTLLITKLLFEEPEAGPDAIFGKYAFDSKRKDIKKQDKEPNTEIENEIEKSISKYVGWNSPGELSNFAPILLKLVKQGLYKPILDPLGKQDIVFRVIHFDSVASAKEAFPQMLRGIVGNKTGEQKIYRLESGILKPYETNISGWTTDKNEILSQVSSKTNSDGKSLLMIFQARISHNIGKFFGKPGKLGAIVESEHEMETIGYGPIQYEKLEVIIPRYFI